MTAAPSRVIHCWLEVCVQYEQSKEIIITTYLLVIASFMYTANCSCNLEYLITEQDEKCKVEFYGDRKIDDPYGCSEEEPSNVNAEQWSDAELEQWSDAELEQWSEKARFQHMLSEILQKLLAAN